MSRHGGSGPHNAARSGINSCHRVRGKAHQSAGNATVTSRFRRCSIVDSVAEPAASTIGALCSCTASLARHIVVRGDLCPLPDPDLYRSHCLQSCDRTTAGMRLLRATAIRAHWSRNHRAKHGSLHACSVDCHFGSRRTGDVPLTNCRRDIARASGPARHPPRLDLHARLAIASHEVDNRPGGSKPGGNCGESPDRIRGTIIQPQFYGRSRIRSYGATCFREPACRLFSVIGVQTVFRADPAAQSLEARAWPALQPCRHYQGYKRS